MKQITGEDKKKKKKMSRNMVHSILKWKRASVVGTGKNMSQLN